MCYLESLNALRISKDQTARSIVQARAEVERLADRHAEREYQFMNRAVCRKLKPDRTSVVTVGARIDRERLSPCIDDRT